MYMNHLNPEVQEEQAARVDYLSSLFGEYMLNHDYQAIDEYVSDCPRLVGVQAEEWLETVTNMNKDFEEFRNNINVVTNSLELMTNYVEYLIESGEYA